MRPWILERAARTPAAPALLARGGALSWAELAARARARAAALRAAGVAPGDRVAALAGNDPAFVEWLHAAPLAGAVLVPLNVRLAAPELGAQLADAGARLLLHGPGPLAALAREAAAVAAASAVAAPCLAPVDVPAQEAAGALAAGGGARSRGGDDGVLDPSAPAVIVYTSGTSGEPKGVVLRHANLLASALASALHLGALPGERWLACLPLFHVGGLAILARSVVTGGAVVLHERFDAEAVSDALDAGGVALASFVPTMLARVLEVRGERSPPATLRAVLLGGAAAPAPLLARAARAGWPLLPTYGLSEAASQVATLPPGAPIEADGGGLRPLPGVELRIGEGGEIQVRGPTVMAGYWRRPEASARALAGGWLRTGDLGAIDARGALRVLGRADDMLVTGGENVHPAEVEAALLAHPAVSDAGVAGVPDPELGQRVTAWIVLAPGERADPAALERFARSLLAGYKVPRRFRFVAALPRNAGGKLLRRQLGAGG